MFILSNAMGNVVAPWDCNIVLNFIILKYLYSYTLEKRDNVWFLLIRVEGGVDFHTITVSGSDMDLLLSIAVSCMCDCSVDMWDMGVKKVSCAFNFLERSPRVHFYFYFKKQALL